MSDLLSKRSAWPLFPVDRKTLQKKVRWPLERLAFRMMWLLLLLCPFWWCIDSLERNPSTQREWETKAWEKIRALWVGGWLALLATMWLANPAPCLWRGIVAAFAIVRLLEIFVTGLGTILHQTQQVQARNLVTIVAYVIQVTLIFAILDHSFAFERFATDSGELASGASDYLYISWSDVVTLDNAYTPTGAAARFLGVLTTTSSIFLLSVLLAFGIDAVSENERGAGRPGGPGST